MIAQLKRNQPIIHIQIQYEMVTNLIFFGQIIKCNCILRLFIKYIFDIACLASQMETTLQQLFSDIKAKKLQVFQTQKSLAYDLAVQQLKIFQSTILSFSLTITNSTNQQIHFHQTFPNITLPISQCDYLFPQEPLIYSNAQGKYSANYGGRMHFPFTSIGKDGQCLFIAIRDTSGGFKEIKLQKKGNNIRFGALYYDLHLKKDEKIVLPSVIIVFDKIIGSLFHTSIRLYKKYSPLWLQLVLEKQPSNFELSFAMRVIELYQLEWHPSHKRLNNIQEINLLVIMLKEDEERIGKIGFMHLRDWSAQGNGMNTKFGNYLSKQMVGDKIQKFWLRDQIRKIQMNHNTQVGLYIQGYLVSKEILSSHPSLEILAQRMQMLDSQGKPYTIWGDKNLTLCNSDPQWRGLLKSTVRRVYEQLQPSAIYIDEFGFGFKTSPYKNCTAEHHRHCQTGNKSEPFDLQKGELWTLKTISKSSRNKGLKIYIQQIPCDVAFPFIDGCLSSAAKLAASAQSSIPILITRFVHPQIKIFQLITEYTMSEQQILPKKCNPQNVTLLLRAIAISFWNGNGIYIPKNLAFYNEKVLHLIKTLNNTFTEYKDFFWGKTAQPLSIGDVDKGVEQIVGNKWINKFDKEVYVLANFGKLQHSTILEGLHILMQEQSVGFYAYGKYEYLASFS